MFKLYTAFIVSFFILTALSLTAQTVWFFQDGNNPGYYDLGLAFKTTPSTVEQTGGSGDKIPTSTAIFYQGNNSLKLRWTSKTTGDWSALVIAPGFPLQDITQTDTMAFWAYALDGLDKSAMPKIGMECGSANIKTKKYNIGDYSPNLVSATWTEVKIPLSIFFTDGGNSSVDFSRTKAIIFSQNTADAVEHILYIDNVRTYRTAVTSTLGTPTNLAASGYDSHIELNWTAAEGTPDGYQIWRSADNGATFTLLKTINATTVYEDFIGNSDAPKSFKYKIKAVKNSEISTFSNETAATVKTMTDEELLTMVQRHTFRYFWEFAHPTSGMARERNTSADVVTTGGTGFGISAIVVAVERGFITRTEGVNQLVKIVNFLSTAERFHGVFPHWMDGKTGKVIPFSTLDNGGDLVETSFLFQGLLTAKQYFNKTTADETGLRNTIQQLWAAVEWDWYRQGGQNVLYWHWSPNYAWRMNFALRGYYEALITYVLAVASPTKPIPANLYHQGWAGSPNYVNNQTYYGYKLFVGPLAGGPLFFAHYSFIGFDPRDKKDAYANYFIHNQNQSLINWTFCKENPKQWKGYSGDNWGLTASDDPNGYSAHEPLSSNDNGTISPTAALSSMPYTPSQSIAALKYFYRKEGANLWGTMGFYDAFNPTRNWYANSYLAIDQGPIICMIENYRTGLLWKNFMQNPEIQTALDAIGFTKDNTTTVKNPLSTSDDFTLKIYPNPSQEHFVLEFDLFHNETVSLDVLDINGRIIKTIIHKKSLPLGKNQITVEKTGLKTGFYMLLLRGANFEKKGKVIVN
jgi:hypothetical protein